MTSYLIAMTGILAFIGGHALARLGETGDWFYRFSFTLFTGSSLVLGLAAAYFPT